MKEWDIFTKVHINGIFWPMTLSKILKISMTIVQTMETNKVRLHIHGGKKITEQLNIFDITIPIKLHLLWTIWSIVWRGKSEFVTTNLTGSWLRGLHRSIKNYSIFVWKVNNWRSERKRVACQNILLSN